MGTTTYAQISKATLTASGLTCSMCSKAIYEALNKVDFVNTIKANIKESSYSITFKNDQKVDFDALRKAVEGAGFSVASLQITANFSNMQVDNDVMIPVSGENLHFLNVKSQTLNGEVNLKLVDTKFTTEKLRKQYSKFTSMQCFNTGIAQGCCAKTFASGSRIYHVTI